MSEAKAIVDALDRIVDGSNQAWACGCMGPQGDQPRCPGAMGNVIRYRDTWIEIKKIITPADEAVQAELNNRLEARLARFKESKNNA